MDYKLKLKVVVAKREERWWHKWSVRFRFTSTSPCCNKPMPGALDTITDEIEYVCSRCKKEWE